MMSEKQDHGETHPLPPVKSRLDLALEKMVTEPKWSDLSKKEKRVRVATIVARVVTIFVLLYFFICSLDLLASAFRLIAGKTTG